MNDTGTKKSSEKENEEKRLKNWEKEITSMLYNYHISAIISGNIINHCLIDLLLFEGVGQLF